MNKFTPCLWQMMFLSTLLATAVGIRSEPQAPALGLTYQVQDLGVHPNDEQHWPWVQEITPALAHRAFRGMVPHRQNRWGQWVGVDMIHTVRPRCGFPRATFWSGGRRAFLTNLPDSGGNAAHAINDKGEIVGSSWGFNSWRDDVPQDNATEIAVLWRHGQIYNLMDYVPKGWRGRLSVGYAIDNAGDILASDARSMSGEHFYLLIPNTRK